MFDVEYLHTNGNVTIVNLYSGKPFEISADELVVFDAEYSATDCDGEYLYVGDFVYLEGITYEVLRIYNDNFIHIVSRDKRYNAHLDAVELKLSLMQKT